MLEKCLGPFRILFANSAWEDFRLTTSPASESNFYFHRGVQAWWDCVSNAEWYDRGLRSSPWNTSIYIFIMEESSLYFLVSSPDPLQHCKRKGCLVNIVQHFCTSSGISGWYNLIGEFGNYPTCTGLPYHNLYSSTHHTFTGLLSTPSNLLKPSKRLQRFSF